MVIQVIHPSTGEVNKSRMVYSEPSVIAAYLCIKRSINVPVISGQVICDSDSK